MAETEVLLSNEFRALIERATDFLHLNDSPFMLVLLSAILLAVISLYVWEFYRSISKRNLISLNLSQYNRTEHPFLSKFFATTFYLLEYIIIIPFLITLWFAGLAIVLLLIAEQRRVEDILLIAAAMIGAIRLLAYYNGEISKDLAKMFPFIAISIFLLSPSAFSLEGLFSRILQIPSLLNNLLSYLLVIIVMEIVLRGIYSLYLLIQGEDGKETKE